MKKMSRTAMSVIYLIVFILFICLFAIPMGLANMLNTVMNTAYGLLMDTCFYLMAIAVIMGALGAVLSELGVIELLNKLLSPLMKPVYGLPGAAALGVLTTYLSDNPAILSLAADKKYRACFKEYQIPALTNIGTSFGMGLIVTSYMLGLSTNMGESTVMAVICGNLGAIAGSILSTRLMISYCKRDPELSVSVNKEIKTDTFSEDMGKPKLMDAIIRGGKNGVEMGLGIIPGVVVICTVVMMLSGKMPEGGYTGAAYEGIGLLPAIGGKLNFILQPLFGFKDAGCIAVPITALGAAGASLGLIPSLIAEGIIDCNALAVFTSMCMCWSGYLSTHVSMMEVLGYRRLSGKAILYHTFGGLFAGVTAHWLYAAFKLIMGWQI